VFFDRHDGFPAASVGVTEGVWTLITYHTFSISRIISSRTNSWRVLVACLYAIGIGSFLFAKLKIELMALEDRGKM